MKSISTGPLIGRKTRVVLALAALVAVGVFFLAGSVSDKPAEKLAETTKANSAKPALTVSLVTPEKLDWPQVLPANGSVVAWQEAVIGPEISNYRITEVRVQVGDQVKKGQVLARIASDTAVSYTHLTLPTKRIV